MKTALILLVIFAFACNSSKKSAVKENPVTDVGLPISSQWILENFADSTNIEISKNSFITISQDHKTYSGNAGCNKMHGALTINGNNIKFEQAMMTKMACEYLAQEQLFMQNLLATTKYKIVAGELFLYKGNKLLMTLESWR